MSDAELLSLVVGRLHALILAFHRLMEVLTSGQGSSSDECATRRHIGNLASTFFQGWHPPRLVTLARLYADPNPERWGVSFVPEIDRIQDREPQEGESILQRRAFALADLRRLLSDSPSEEAGSGEPRPDGPFDADGFRFGSVEVRFERAALRYRLILALWDVDQKRPASPRPIEDVIAEVYQSEDVEDNTFRKLCSAARNDLRKANCPLEIKPTQGKVRLIRL